MRQSTRSRRSGGFTLIEVLIVVTVLFIIALVLFPALQQFIVRNKLLGITRHFAVALQGARQHAIKTQVPVVAEADFVNDALQVFANVDGDPDFSYPGDVFDQAWGNALPVGRHDNDYRISTVALPRAANPRGAVYFWGPADASPENADAIDGLTTTPDGRQVAIFNADGSITDTGAFRIADRRGNFLEVRLGPQATARVVVQKYYKDAPPWGGTSDFFPQGRHPDGHALWRWWY